ncbi:MAG: translation initiation factor IF-6 [Thermoproteota archaeon]|nr:translation initiation factor IF-6 [Thermoproteota archaeon]
MPIFLFDVFGSASIGVYSLTTDQLLIVPPQGAKTKTRKLGEWLKVKLVETSIGGSVLVGVLACANSNGIVLPHFIRDGELETIKSASDWNVTVMNTKQTAYGNMVLTNDYGAVVDPTLKQKNVEEISDTLGVETVAGEIAGLPYVGSLALATNKGVLAHPLLKKSERKLLKDVLKVKVDVGSVNCGIPYVATGLVGNKQSAVAGVLTTGPELFIIGQALDVVG